MTPDDAAYLKFALDAGLVRGPVLEIGSQEIPGQVGNGAAMCREHGVDWEGADLELGPGVDWLLDITARNQVESIDRQWNTVIMFNVVEHVYDPLAALRHALQLTAVGGHLVVVSPAVWQLHDYPADYWRPLPDVYLEFARRERCSVVEPAFRWILADRTIQVLSHADATQKFLPAKFPMGDRVFGRRRIQRSRVVHRLFDTIGRDLAFPYAALGVSIRRD